MKPIAVPVLLATLIGATFTAIAQRNNSASGQGTLRADVNVVSANKSNWDGMFRKVAIEAGKGFKIAARDGYYAKPRN